MRSLKDRIIQLGERGFLNPDADMPCGAVDFLALLPEPIHVGGCKRCREICRNILIARKKPPARAARKSAQTSFDFTLALDGGKVIGVTKESKLRGKAKR